MPEIAVSTCDGFDGKKIPRRRRWFQFSLGTLLLFVTAVSILMSWVAVERRQAARERFATEHLEEAVRHPFIRGADPRGGWFASLLGREFAPALQIFTDGEAMDADPERNWALLTDLRSLKSCEIFYDPFCNEEFLGPIPKPWLGSKRCRRIAGG